MTWALALALALALLVVVVVVVVVAVALVFVRVRYSAAARNLSPHHLSLISARCALLALVLVLVRCAIRRVGGTHTLRRYDATRPVSHSRFLLAARLLLRDFPLVIGRLRSTAAETL